MSRTHRVIAVGPKGGEKAHCVRLLLGDDRLGPAVVEFCGRPPGEAQIRALARAWLAWVKPLRGRGARPFFVTFSDGNGERHYVTLRLAGRGVPRGFKKIPAVRWRGGKPQGGVVLPAAGPDHLWEEVGSRLGRLAFAALKEGHPPKRGEVLRQLEDLLLNSLLARWRGVS